MMFVKFTDVGTLEKLKKSSVPDD